MNATYELLLFVIALTVLTGFVTMNIWWFVIAVLVTGVALFGEPLYYYVMEPLQ